MRKRIAGLLLALLVLAAASAFAVQEELLEEGRKLVKDAQPFVEQANNLDLEMDARKGPRKEAFTRLKRARELYNQYLDANPSMEDKLDKEYVDLVAMLYWIKKDSTLGELEKDGPNLELPHAPDAPPGNPASPDKPKPPEWKDKPTPGQPQKDEPAAPSDLPQRAKRQFDAIADYQKEHPGDLPRLLDFWQRFLVDYPDPSLPEYAEAVARIGKINERMNGVLKDVAKRDPDTIPGAESKAEKSIFGRLLQDFNAKDAEVRRRAAKLMADSRARSATYFLARGLLDADQELASICREGLVAIGGKFTGDNLVTLYRDAPKEKQAKALGVLSDVTKKGPVDAAAVSPAIGKFALSNDPDVAGSAISLLTALGKPGGPGLLVALDSKLPDKKVAVMDALAAIKYYRASARMAEYLVTGDGVVLEQLRAAAIRNLKSMGVYVVPYLIPMLSSPSKQYVALTLREITGAMIGMGNPKEWRKWWNENKPKDAEEP